MRRWYVALVPVALALAIILAGASAAAHPGRRLLRMAVGGARCSTVSEATATALARLSPRSAVVGRTHLDSEGAVRYWDIEVRKVDRTRWSAEVGYGTCRTRIEPN